jgi:putative endonuclease
MPYVYLLRCRDGSLYAGAALELARRLAEHGAGRASRYTRSRLPVELVWWRQVGSWSAALREEAVVKRLKRAAKEILISAGAGAPAGDGGDGQDGASGGSGAAGQGSAARS